MKAVTLRSVTTLTYIESLSIFHVDHPWVLKACYMVSLENSPSGTAPTWLVFTGETLQPFNHLHCPPLSMCPFKMLTVKRSMHLETQSPACFPPEQPFSTCWKMPVLIVIIFGRGCGSQCRFTHRLAEESMLGEKLQLSVVVGPSSNGGVGCTMP